MTAHEAAVATDVLWNKLENLQQAFDDYRRETGRRIGDNEANISRVDGRVDELRTAALIREAVEIDRQKRQAEEDRKKDRLISWLPDNLVYILIFTAGIFVTHWWH